MAGETEHAKGADGTWLAKRWLERTTRAQVRWEQPDPIAVRKLTFERPGGKFSFDIGGSLVGGEVDSQDFFAEVKKYKDAQDQPTLFREFLAKCYRAYEQRPERCDNFMWITWAPFNSTDWSKLDKPEKVQSSVREKWKYNFISEDEAMKAELDGYTIKEVADRIWILVLSDRQVYHLSMSDDHLSVITRYETLERAKR
ncbi:hypothetical protein [Nocardia sp. NBC_00416]|uniref:hypothetical protein n=1 Tax=Nocardia sp. NBC_00416 TaxID=2975991 RepID=UPI002E1F137B